MKRDRLTLKLPEKIENADGTACAQLLAQRGQKFDQNRPLWIGTKLCFLVIYFGYLMNILDNFPF